MLAKTIIGDLVEKGDAEINEDGTITVHQEGDEEGDENLADAMAADQLWT
jgi:hypothetical protein